MESRAPTWTLLPQKVIISLPPCVRAGRIRHHFQTQPLAAGVRRGVRGAIRPREPEPTAPQRVGSIKEAPPARSIARAARIVNFHGLSSHADRDWPAAVDRALPRPGAGVVVGD